MRATLATQRYNWEQGTVAQAFLETGETEIAVQMAVEAVNRQIEDGRCAQVGPPESSTDPCGIGEALIFACETTGDPALIEGRDRLLDWALHRAPRSERGVVYHLESSRQFWVDSLYMLPPFLARAGYVKEAMLQINGWWDALFDPQTRLLAHIWDDGAKTFIRSAKWGVGNGWAAAGLTRVIGMLPEGDTQRNTLVDRVTRLLHTAFQYHIPPELLPVLPLTYQPLIHASARSASVIAATSLSERAVPSLLNQVQSSA